jgi:hypothetical protein
VQTLGDPYFWLSSLLVATLCIVPVEAARVWSTAFHDSVGDHCTYVE